MATNVVERLQVDIQSNAAQLQAEMAKGEQAIRGVAKAAGEAATLQQGLGQRVGAAAVQISSGFETMARAGKIGGDGLKQVIAQGSNLAFMFGPQGALLGAIGIASLAIVEVFKRTREEARTLTEETRKSIDDLQFAGDFAALTKRARELQFGTRVEDGVLTGGVVQAKAEVAKAEAALAAVAGRSLVVQQRAEKKLAAAKQEVDRLENEIAATLTALRALEQRTLTPPETPAIRITATAPKSDPGAAQRAAESARQQAAALRDLEQGFEDLFARVLGGSVSLEDFDRTVRELGDGFRDKLKAPTAEQAEAFALLADKALTVRDALVTMQAAETAAEFDALRAALTPTVVDDFRVRLERLRKTLAKRFTAEQVQDLLAMEGALADVAIGMEQLDARIGAIKGTAISAFDAQLGLAAELQATEELLRQLATSDDALGGDDAALIRIAGLREQIKKLREEIEALDGRKPSGVSDEAAQQRAVAKAQQLGRAIEDIGRLTITAADAFGVLSDEAAKALAASVDVAAGIGRIFAGDASGGSAQTANGVIALLSSVLGKDPASEQRKREHQENIAALRSIVKNTGDLVGVQTSGRDIAGIRGAVGELLATTGNAGGFRRFGDGPLRNINEAAFLEFRTGLDFKQIEALAKSLGVTLNGTKDSYLAFERALKALDLAAITQGFSGQLRRLEIEARLDPAAFEGIDGLLQRLRVLAGPDGAPAIAAALGDLSQLTTSEGRAAAIERLTNVLRNVASLDVADLGGLSLDQFIEEILGAIEKLREAEPAVQSAGERFRDAMELLGLQVELGGYNAAVRLDKVKAAFEASFGDAFTSLDFSSLESLKASIAGIIASLTADGKLTDEERALAEALRTLLGAFQDTQPVLVDFIATLRDQFAIFGTDALGRFEALGAALGDAFPTIAELVAGIDLARDPAALEKLRANAQAIFALLAADGVTAEEQRVIDAIKQILDAAADVATEIADATEKQLQEQERKRQAILAGAETRIRLNDITDPAEQLRIRMAALATAFPALAAVLGDFDATTQEGRDALEAWIRSIADTPAALEQLAAAMGITVDELLAALVGLEEGADAAATKVATLAETLGAAFDAVDFAAELEGITDPLERLKRTSAAVADVLPEVADIFKQFSLDTAEGRAGAEAALIALGKSTSDAAVRSAVLKLLQQIRGVPTPEATLGDVGGSRASGTGRANVAAASTITEVTANRLVDLFQRNVIATEAIRDAMTAGVARAIAPLPSLSAPPLPSLAGAFQNGSAGGAAGSGVNLNFTFPQIVFAGPVTTADADELSRLVQQRFVELVQGGLATELLVALRRAGVARAT